MAIVCMTTSLFAQSIQFKQGDKSNKKAYLPEAIHIVEAQQDGLLLVVEPDLNAFSVTKAIKVRLCDMEWKDTKSLIIPDTKGYKIKKAFKTGDKLHLLLSFVDNDFVKLRKISIDAQTLDITNDEFVVNHEFTAAQRGSLITTSSPSGSRHSVVFSLWSDNGGNYVASSKVFLFDNDMKQLWQQNLKTPEVHEVIVTDRGEVVTAAMGYMPEQYEDALVLFNLADANGVAAAEFNTHADLSQMALLNYSDGKVVFTALEGKGDADRARTSIRPGYVEGSRKYSAVHAYSFYIPTSHLVAEQRHAFTPAEICCFENKSSANDTATDNLSYLNQCATEQGGAVIYHRGWMIERIDRRTGASNSTAHSLGMIVCQVDMDGNFTNITRIRQHNQNAGLPKVGADILAYKGKLYVVTNESENESDDYTPDVPAKRSSSLIKANTGLSIYAISPDGAVKKQMLEKKRNALLFTPLFAGSKGMFYFLSGSMKPLLSSVKINDD